ncbi:MAG: DUF397 domain-containing protein [Candidatus Zambryskibacteria bacterium]|nr:DUF397 domain-containing protein [Candidatus Zambryskibacteria bacterium]
MLFKFPVANKDFAKSTGSDGKPFCCVEVARKRQGVAVRDSKNRRGGTLFFTNAEWKAFLEGAKGGEFEVAE